MTTTALKLAFAPDEYLVTWHLPTGGDSTFSSHGVIAVAGDEQPTGTAHGDFPHIIEQAKSDGAAFPQYVDVPQLVGRLANGANVLLVNARVTYWFPNQARIDAGAAIITLADVSADKPSKFQRFEAQIGGLDSVAGTAPITKTTFPKGGSGTWSAQLNPDRNQTWADGHVSLSLDFDGSFRAADAFAFRMGFSPVVRGDIGAPASLTEIVETWITPLRNIVSIATGKPQSVTYASLKIPTDEEHEHSGQLFGTSITQDPFESTLEAVRKADSPLQLKSDGVSLLELVRQWQAMASVYHPLIETYGWMLHARDQHPRSRFLLLLQAIEGTYGFETKASFAERLKKHEEDREAVIDAAMGALDEKQQKFMDNNLAKRPPAGLESAINWLAKRLPGDVRKRLDATPSLPQQRPRPPMPRPQRMRFASFATTLPTATRATTLTSCSKS